MKTTFYTKKGRRYYPVREYDSDLLDSMPEGVHMVCVEPGLRSVRYNVNPDHAGLLAAFAAHRDELCKLIQKATSYRFGGRALTERERRARDAYCKAMGADGMIIMESASAQEVVDVLEKRLIEFANRGKP